MGNIFLIEDSEEKRTIVYQIADLLHHEISLVSTTLEGALVIIAGNAIEDLDINIAIVDGNLNNIVNTGEDGDVLSKAISDKYGDKVKIIGYATDRDVLHAHVNCRKIEGTGKLISILKSI